MKDSTYSRIVDELQFTKLQYQDVISRCAQNKQHHRHLRITFLVAALLALLGTSTYVIGTELAERDIVQQELGQVEKNLADSEVMKFTMTDDLGGIQVHAMKLQFKRRYQFRHGMLYSDVDGFMRITDDYILEPVSYQTIDEKLEKNGRIYHIKFDYVDKENGVISTHKSLYQKNHNGEILLNATDGNSNQWPVYVNPETGSIRDALPDWTTEDFEGRVAYGQMLRNGILVSTVVSDKNNTGEYNKLYWIEEGATEAKLVNLPSRKMIWYVENDTIYCKNTVGKLYEMDENFEFRIVSEFNTYDDPTCGILTVRTSSGELGIHDVINDELYVINDLKVSTGDIDETMGFNASRYSYDGKIVLICSDLNWEKSQVCIDKIGILNPNEGKIQMIDIHNEYDGYHNGWLDENRFGVVYQDGHENYLCIYEFK